MEHKSFNTSGSQGFSNGNGFDNEDPTIISSIWSVPVTRQRPPATSHPNIKEAGIARANLAVTEQSPEGTTEGGYSNEHQERTVLQQHVDFFDLNQDGVITPVETYKGFREIGFGILLSLLAAILINSGFSYLTAPSWIPDPLFRIYTKNIHHTKHGSDSDTYDHEGRFRPQMFEDIFSKYGTQAPNGEWGITYRQSLQFLSGQRCPHDIFGMSAAAFEWLALYLLLSPSDGVMKMEDVRGVFDGSYFYKVAGARKAKKA